MDDPSFRSFVETFRVHGENILCGQTEVSPANGAVFSPAWNATKTMFYHVQIITMCQRMDGRTLLNIRERFECRRQTGEIIFEETSLFHLYKHFEKGYRDFCDTNNLASFYQDTKLVLSFLKEIYNSSSPKFVRITIKSSLV